MKKQYYLLICALLTSCLSYSQDTILTKNEYEKDTLQGRHFGQFIKPVNGFILKSDYESPYFKKCKNIETQDDKSKCFSDIFYENLRKQINFNSNHSKETEISLIVKFTISKTGEILNISFPQSNDLTGGFEKEIIRVLKKLPKIIPAKKNGEFVSITYSFPIKFNK